MTGERRPAAVIDDLGASGRLEAARIEAIHELARRASVTDGVAPLSEQFLLDLAGTSGARHLLAVDHDDDMRLLGYAQLSPEGESAELVVDPRHRRLGIGAALVEALVHAADDDLRIWAHGGLPVAAALAQRLGWVPVRELHVMAASRETPGQETSGRQTPGQQTPEPETATAGQDRAERAPQLPPAYTVRAFVPGQDEQAWLATNAAAFAHHPEQGGMTLADLREREQLDWFDPAGFLLVTPRDDPQTVAAFHWTKVHPPGELSPAVLGPAWTGADDPVGEVFVVGIHPDHQGRGLARPLTELGLAHLRDAGMRSCVLWVDGDNTRAVSTYAKSGFVVTVTDRQYAPAASSTEGAASGLPAQHRQPLAP